MQSLLTFGYARRRRLIPTLSTAVGVSGFTQESILRQGVCLSGFTQESLSGLTQE